MDKTDRVTAWTRQSWSLHGQGRHGDCMDKTLMLTGDCVDKAGTVTAWTRHYAYCMDKRLMVTVWTRQSC